MPDMPQQGAPQGAPAQGDQGGAGGPPQGGGIADAIVQVDQTLYKITQAAQANPQVPKEVKDNAQAALSAFRTFSQSLVKAVGGEADGQPEPDEDDAGGTTTPEQGASGAVPMSHANMRGG